MFWNSSSLRSLVALGWPERCVPHDAEAGIGQHGRLMAPLEMADLVRKEAMKFRFAARVIAQLGAELISSDDIAVYELIKNAFDAGSKRVKLEIRYLVSIHDIARAQAEISHLEGDDAKLSAMRKFAHGVVESL